MCARTGVACDLYMLRGQCRTSSNNVLVISARVYQLTVVMLGLFKKQYGVSRGVSSLCVLRQYDKLSRTLHSGVCVDVLIWTWCATL